MILVLWRRSARGRRPEKMGWMALNALMDKGYFMVAVSAERCVGGYSCAYA
jgi:hypothetical protein